MSANHSAFINPITTAASWIVRALIALLAVLMFVPDKASADTVTDPGLGMLMLENQPDDQHHLQRIPAILLETTFEIEVNGPVASIRMRQEFFNPHAEFGSAEYIFPLPENASVHAMRMQIGDKLIIGSVHAKQQAEAIFQQAKQAGQQAALTEQLSSNVFRSKVAHIAAGDTIAVQLEYREVIQPQGDSYRLRIPTTMTPRYWPNDIDTPPDATRHQWPAHYVQAGQLASEFLNMFSLDMQLNAGLPLATITSSSHDLATRQQPQVGGQQSSQQRYLIELVDGYDIMDRDLMIEWQLEADDSPRVVVLREQLIDDNNQPADYAMVMLQPPSVDWQHAEQLTAVMPRDIIFILDRSGSMGGISIQQAKASLAYALGHLEPTDRFNIIDFSDSARQLSDQPLSASNANLILAGDYLHKLSAGGGTNMHSALELALQSQTNAQRLQQIIFVTDGAIGNEQSLLRMLDTQLQDARLFTVGIGAAPNSFFMRKAAQFGRGSMHMINDINQVESHMNKLLTQLKYPALTNVRFHYYRNGQLMTMDRENLPDVYLGEPIQFTSHFGHWPDELRLTGFDGQPWQHTIDLHQIAADATGIAALWGKDKIEELLDDLHLGADEVQIRPQVLQLALTHQLLTPYTSFVAVEQKPVNPEPADNPDHKLANLMPHGTTLNLPATANGLGFWYALLLLVFAIWALGLRRRKPDGPVTTQPLDSYRNAGGLI